MQQKESNWQYKSIENLENDHWSEPEYDSNLIITVHRLRKIPLNELSQSDIRVLLSQSVGLNYTASLAIEIIKEDPMAETDFYPGDLLKELISIDQRFWIENQDLHLEFMPLINNLITDDERLNEMLNKFINR